MSQLNLNFSNSTPAAPAGHQNVTFLGDGHTNVSAYDPAFVGDSGSGGKAGNVPAPTAGDAAAGKFLHASGSFQVPTLTGVWQSWTPTLSGSGSMTVSSPTISDAQYVQLGPIVYFKLWVSTMTLGGTAAGAIIATLPTSQVGQPSAVTLHYTNGAVTGFAPGVGYAVGGNQIQCFIAGSGNWTLGAAQILVEGFYRAS